MEAIEEQAVSVEPVESTEQAERVFDFTQPDTSAMDEQTKEAYFRLRRVALLANDASGLPDGKTYTESQVVEILGEDYAAGLGIGKKCCG